MLDAGDLRRAGGSFRTAALLALGASVVLSTRWVVGRSGRVLGWALVAVILAGLLHPIVERLAAHIRRGLAIAAVAVGMLVGLGVVAFFAVDDIRRDLDRVRFLAPRSAARWERDDRFGPALRDMRLRERVDEFLDAIPGRLVGGEGVDAVRAATTRGLAVFITLILTLFLVGFARTFVGGTSRWLAPSVTRVAAAAYRRAHRYLVFMAAKAVVVGVVVFLATRTADVPGAAVFAVAAALGSLVPRVGLVVALAPVALLDVAVRPGAVAALVAVGLALVLQVADWVVLHRWIEPRSLEIGSALPLVVFLLGIELWGIGGALCGLALLPVAVAWWDEHHEANADGAAEPSGGLPSGP